MTADPDSNTSDHRRRTAVAIAAREEAAHPMITASGQGWRAEKILEVAFAEGVKVREDAELAALLAQFDELSPIPLEAVHAVAVVLSHVYAESRRGGDTP
ncbi:MAG: EscU/YscU/HrcU family type III secretion system export apparatus switch protein [Pseudomonadota bacterium]|jgi:flagellar biosynthesis protein